MMFTEKLEEHLTKTNICYHRDINNVIIIEIDYIQLHYLFEGFDKDFLKSGSIKENSNLYLEEFLIKRNIDYYKDINNIIIIMAGYLYFDLDSLSEVDEDFLNGCIINGDLDLRGLKQIPEGFLSNTMINGYLNLYDIKYLPKGFKPKVKDEIYLSIPSIIKDLIRCPGIKRELGFNLLR